MGLRAKFFAGMVAIVLLLGAAMFLTVQIAVRDRLFNTLQHWGVASAWHIAANSVDPVLTEELFQLELMFHALQEQEENILYIFVLDPAGRVLAHTFAGGFPEELRQANVVPGPGEVSVRRLATEEGEIIDIAVPMLRGELGGVRVGLSAAEVQKDVDAIIRLLVWLIVGGLLMGGLGVFLFDLFITRPIVALAEVARAVGQGDMEQRTELRGSDEISLLGQALDRMIERRGQVEREREELITQLQQALAEIKTLQGILPICAGCKKIRDDKGYWNQIESFFRERTDVDFSHGLCPDCAHRLYPEMAAELGNGKEGPS
jgi:methyl-accepting chemotaxis protein